MKTLSFKKLQGNRVKCGICHQFCIIDNGKRGLCQVRENREGELYSLVYPKIIARAIDPIEKKPIFHLRPGSTSFSIATAGCNFQCTFCQNSDISQLSRITSQITRQPRNKKTENILGVETPDVETPGVETPDIETPGVEIPDIEIPGVEIPPEMIVAQAVKAGCESISYTYTEPTVYFELALAMAKIAHAQGLLNIFVTNGFMSKEVIEMAAPYLDAANVDLKAFNDGFYRKWCKARLEPVKENLILMKSLGILVEVTTLLIPGLNDDPDEINAMARFIAGSLGLDTPWHISRFHPCYQMTDRGSTPIATLEMAHQAGRNAGLRYVYTGNAPGLDSENTFCHVCGKLLIKRFACNIQNHVTDQGSCPDCGNEVYGIFKSKQ